MRAQAYLAGDRKTLQDWCSDACYGVLTADLDARDAAGLKVDSRILDLRNVEVRRSTLGWRVRSRLVVDLWVGVRRTGRPRTWDC